MPIWISLTVLVVAPIAILTAGAYIEMDLRAMAALALTVEAGAAMVLVDRTFVAWIAPRGTHQPLWADWAFLVVGPLAAILTMTWKQIHASRENAAANRPAGRCGRCGADLYADPAGRYFSSSEGYLCPPDKRLPGQRRHQFEVGSTPVPADRTTQHGARWR
jgi:hypothetical protein